MSVTSPSSCRTRSPREASGSGSGLATGCWAAAGRSSSSPRATWRRSRRPPKRSLTGPTSDLRDPDLRARLYHRVVTHKLQADVVYLDPSGRDDSNRRRAMRAIVVSSFGLLLTSAFEISVTVLSGSVALLSDALHNLGDVFTTVGVYFGFRASRKQPTRRYPYGYGRAEDLTGIVIVIAIWSSAALAGWQSYDKLVSGRGTTRLTLGMVAAVVGIVGNQLLARYKLAGGRAIKSAPLLVDARHSMLDAIASAGALAGLIGVALRVPVADPIAGLRS